MTSILITGSHGLVGSALTRALQARHFGVRGFDLRLPRDHPEHGDTANPDHVARAIDRCSGIIHLAAVSRVIWAQQDPAQCWRTNVEGTRNVLRAAAQASSRPWVLFASSREVYGQPRRLPANEDTPRRPVNIYGHSKVEGETLTLRARKEGLATAVMRLSNVYGSVEDHHDRVVPAFSRSAVEGTDLRVLGSSCTFDFTHLDDTIAGVLAIVDALEGGERGLPPVQLTTGQGTTLGQLAEIAQRAAGNGARLVELPERDFDVAHFIGDARRARELFGWSAQIDIAEGVGRMVADFAAKVAQQPLHPGRKAWSARDRSSPDVAAAAP